MVNSVALKTTANVIYDGSDELFTESNWHQFNQAAPANLKLIEGLWYGDQDNEKLLTLLIKGYGAYGFATHETLGLKDLLTEKEDSFHLQQAILNYEKASYYGLRLLKERGITEQMFFDKSFALQIPKVFDSKMNSDTDVVAIFYFAQAMGSSINLQRTNIKKLAYLGHVQSMFDWACTKKPDLDRGACGLFGAVLQASTPGMMGGSQDKARAAFLKVIKEQPKNLLARASFIQYHLIPMLEEDQFAVEMKKLKNAVNDWYNFQLGRESKSNYVYKKVRYFNLYNSVARQRYQVLKSLKKELF